MELCPEFLESMVQIKSSDSEQESPRSVSSEQQELAGMAGRRKSFIDEYCERVASRSARGSSLASIPTMMEMVNEISTLQTKIAETEAAKSLFETSFTDAQAILSAQTRGIHSFVEYSHKLIQGCERQGRIVVEDEYMATLLNLFRCQDLEENILKSREEVESVPTPRTASWHLVQQEQRAHQQEAHEKITSLELRLSCVVKESVASVDEVKSLKEKNTSLEQEVERLKAALKSKEEKAAEPTLELCAPCTPITSSPSVCSSSECSFDTSSSSDSRQLAHALRRAEVAEQCAAKYRKELFSTTRIENLQDMLLPSFTPPRHVSSLKFSSRRY